MGFLKNEETGQCFELIVGVGCMLCFPLYESSQDKDT